MAVAQRLAGNQSICGKLWVTAFTTLFPPLLHLPNSLSQPLSFSRFSSSGSLPSYHWTGGLSKRLDGHLVAVRVQPTIPTIQIKVRYVWTCLCPEIWTISKTPKDFSSLKQQRLKNLLKYITDYSNQDNDLFSSSAVDRKNCVCELK